MKLVLKKTKQCFILQTLKRAPLRPSGPPATSGDGTGTAGLGACCVAGDDVTDPAPDVSEPPTDMPGPA